MSPQRDALTGGWGALCEASARPSCSCIFSTQGWTPPPAPPPPQPSTGWQSLFQKFHGHVFTDWGTDNQDCGKHMGSFSRQLRGLNFSGILTTFSAVKMGNRSLVFLLCSLRGQASPGLYPSTFFFRESPLCCRYPKTGRWMRSWQELSASKTHSSQAAVMPAHRDRRIS